MPIGGTAFFGANQHPRITTTFLNQLNRTGDPAPGLNVSTAQMSGSIAQPYDGFCGGKLTITNPWAKQFSDPEVGPLYGGIYMYVQVDPLATAPLARGSLVLWLDEMQYIVTANGFTLGPPAMNFKPAGIAVNNTLPGHWDFIQISGIATVQFNAAGVVGQTVIFDGSATPPIFLEPSGSLSSTMIGTVVLADAVANQFGPVELNILQGFNF